MYISRAKGLNFFHFLKKTRTCSRL